MQSRMTFVAAFYSFTIELNHSDRNIFTTFRLKIPRHELEPQEHLYARLLAYTHAYRPGIQFTQGVSEPKEPTIVQRDTVNTTHLWVQVGAPEKRKLELSLKQNPDAEHRIYFYQADDVSRFCHYLRGSKTNWVDRVLFYQLEPALLTRLIDLEASSPHWILSFIDDRMYLTVDGVELESEIVAVDIWEAFQTSLATNDAEQRPASLAD